jgi:dolichyl-phosphate-mannose--protein O-mannosyl transferase
MWPAMAGALVVPLVFMILHDTNHILTSSVLGAAMVLLGDADRVRNEIDG